MLCEICKQRLAMQTKLIDKGFGEEKVAVCLECVKNIDNKQNEEKIVVDFWGDSLKLTKCGVCGTSIEEMLKSGYVGCSTCYKMFSKEFNSFIQSVQGNNRHVGKIPLSILNKQDEQADLSKVMDQALESGSFDLTNIVRNHFPGKRGGR